MLSRDIKKIVKLNTGKAWEDASRLIGSNREPVMVLTGIFFFLPLLVLFQVLFAFDWNLGPEPTPEQIEAQLDAFIAQNWWAIILLVVGQWSGSIALLGLLADRGKPTVGEVMKGIPKLLLPVFAAQVLITLATQFLPTFADLMPGAVGGALGLLAFPISIYIGIKFALTVVVIVVDRVRSPIKAMSRSWVLTKGNSFRILGILFAIAMVAIVLGLVVFISIGLALALAGPEIQGVGMAVLMAMIVAAYGMINVAVTAAIHRQLSPADTDLDPKWSTPL